MKTLLHMCCAPCANQPIRALREAKRLSGRVILLNPIAQGKWKYIRSVQDFANVATMISCSTLRDLAAACRTLTSV